MTPGDSYRAKAAEMNARARRETDPDLRIEFENLARSYLLLAEQAERNARTDVVYEPAFKPELRAQSGGAEAGKAADSSEPAPPESR